MKSWSFSKLHVNTFVIFLPPFFWAAQSPMNMDTWSILIKVDFLLPCYIGQSWTAESCLLKPFFLWIEWCKADLLVWRLSVITFNYNNCCLSSLSIFPGGSLPLFSLPLSLSSQRLLSEQCYTLCHLTIVIFFVSADTFHWSTSAPADVNLVDLCADSSLKRLGFRL